MKKLCLLFICGAVLGGLLGVCGIYVPTWRYWVLMSAFVIWGEVRASVLR